MVNEKEQYAVYPDKLRNVLSIFVYACFAMLEAYFLIDSHLKIYWNILLGVLMVFFIFQVVMNIRTLLQGKPLLVVSGKGIRDYTSGVDFGLIPWGAIEKIETYPGSTSMQIGVLVSKKFTFKNGNANTIGQRNKQRTGFTLSIDSFSFGNKFKETFQMVKKYGLQNKPSLIIKEYVDPFVKKFNKKTIQKQ